jgi:Pyruvate/2-oxoacid:ferredoxin oxidoreductase delta subunit
MGYRQAAFYFYTGTGNSYRVTTWMADAADASGADVTVRSIGSARPAEEIGQGEMALLGLVMPTHGFTVPWVMLRFALRLPRRKGAHGVVVATRAGTKVGPIFLPGIEGTATWLVALVLVLKGYRTRGVTGVDMPSNWIAVHPGLSPETVTEIEARARRRTARFIGAILSGRRRFTGWLSLGIGLFFFPISLVYLLLGRLYLAKLFFASDRCTGCGLCAKHCPNQAIKMLGRGSRRPYWTFRCESCMRCMGYCPTQAIEVNYLLGVGAYLLAAIIPTTALLSWLTARLPALAFLGWMPPLVLETLYAIAVVGLAYPLFHLLLGVRWVNRLFTLITPTHYYRRYHEPDAALEELD